MKFEVGKKYRHDSNDKCEYTCEQLLHGYVVFSWVSGYGKREVYAIREERATNYIEIHEPREIWVNIYKDSRFPLAAHPSPEKAAIGRARVPADTVETVKFREVIE